MNEAQLVERFQNLERASGVYDGKTYEEKLESERAPKPKSE